MSARSISLLIVCWMVQNCKTADFFSQNASDPLVQFYAGYEFHDFNPAFYDSSSLYRMFLVLRKDKEVGRVDKAEVLILKFRPEFRNDVERFFPNSGLIPYTIQFKLLTGQSEAGGPTGFTAIYQEERIYTGKGGSLDSAWNDFLKSGFVQNRIQRKERWESVKDGIWLSEESESIDTTPLQWNHRMGSIDFLYPTTEFRSGTNLSASLYYDYKLNRFQRLKLEKNSTFGILVFTEGDISIHFIDSQLSIVYNQ